MFAGISRAKNHPAASPHVMISVCLCVHSSADGCQRRRSFYGKMRSHTDEHRCTQIIEECAIKTSFTCLYLLHSTGIYKDFYQTVLISPSRQKQICSSSLFRQLIKKSNNDSVFLSKVCDQSFKLKVF